MKLIDHALSLSRLRKLIGWELIWLATKSDLRQTIIERPPGDRALILSPHPDDDVFGCGATILKHRRDRDKVRVVYFCDGSKGNKEGIRDQLLSVRRQKESRQAASILGVEDLVFWNYRDGQLQSTRVIIKALVNILTDFRPDIIYLPSVVDLHPDHRAVVEIFLAAGQLTDLNPTIWCYSYEVWTPQLPNRLVDISREIDLKKQAVACHKSQLTNRPYDAAIIDLNSYRGKISGAGIYAEAFFACRWGLYRKLVKLAL